MNSYSATGAAAPSWYRDPADATMERYWDGAAWTSHVRPASPHMAPPTAAPWNTPTQAAGNAFSIAAIILGALAFLIFPPLFGTVGLILGAVAKSKGEAMATRALIISGLGLVLGMLLGVMVLSS